MSDIELGLMRDNYKSHPRYSEYLAKDGLNDNSWAAYEMFVEWITRPVNPEAYDKCTTCHGLGNTPKRLW